jgi:hypothetical protein
MATYLSAFQPDFGYNFAVGNGKKINISTVRLRTEQKQNV